MGGVNLEAGGLADGADPLCKALGRDRSRGLAITTHDMLVVRLGGEVVDRRTVTKVAVYDESRFLQDVKRPIYGGLVDLGALVDPNRL